MISIYHRRSMTMVSIYGRCTKYNLGRIMTMVGIYGRCIGENLGRSMVMVSIYSRCIKEDIIGISIVGAMIILDNSTRSMHGCNFLHVENVVKLVMTVVVNLLMDLVELIIKGIVTFGKILNVIVVIVQITILGGLRPGNTGHNKQQLEHCRCS